MGLWGAVAVYDELRVLFKREYLVQVGSPPSEADTPPSESLQHRRLPHHHRLRYWQLLRRSLCMNLSIGVLTVSCGIGSTSVLASTQAHTTLAFSHSYGNRGGSRNEVWFL